MAIPRPTDATYDGRKRPRAPRRLALHRGRPYGFTLMSKPRRRTQDVAQASQSRFVYCHDADIWPGIPELEGWYSTSLLGIINGLIAPLNLTFSFDVTEQDNAGGRWIIRTTLGPRHK